ncbi:uncharacterized protein LOC109579964 [Bactrocera dorsalis]|uniref:Uncharacterized protein LOC109579964 n=1 Tax=Bactrocera dorsalis TaxID=27457 RepID=A0ABM3J3J2_BACDO|nr:uncharacterized protein LOC109579964 [Bactrocera dorsalis]
MKFLLVLLALVAAAYSYEFQERLNGYDRSLSSQITDYIENIRTQMPCGFPGLGLGPLSPARLSHRNIALNSSGLVLAGEIDDFTLYGLDDFDFSVKINVLLSRVTFNFHWHKVHFVTNYKMDMNTGNRINAGRTGGAKFAIEDLKIVGSAKYSIIGKVRLREFKVSATIGDVNSEIENLSKIKIVNKKLNQIIEEWILLAVNENTSEMEEMANDFVVPFVNNLIGDATLVDIIAKIGGGSGGDGGNGSGGESEECIPPVVALTDAI